MMSAEHEYVVVAEILYFETVRVHKLSNDYISIILTLSV